MARRMWRRGSGAPPSWCPLGSDGFSGKPFLVADSLEYIMAEGHVDYSLLQPSLHHHHHWAPTTPPIQQHSTSHEPVPPSQKHAMPGSYHKHTSPIDNPPNKPCFGFIKNTNIPFQTLWVWENPKRMPNCWHYIVHALFKRNPIHVPLVCLPLDCHGVATGEAFPISSALSEAGALWTTQISNS